MTVNSCILTLETLGYEKDNWADALIVFLCTSKLPKETLVIFERTLPDNTVIPAWSNLINFLTSEFRGLESATDAKTLFSKPQQNPTHNPRSRQLTDNRNQYEKRGKTFLNVTQRQNADNQFRENSQNELINSSPTHTYPKSD